MGPGVLSRDELFAIECDSLMLHAQAGFDPAQRPGAWKISEEILKTRPRYITMKTRAYLSELHGKDQIFIREGTSRQRARWLCGHEMGHFLYGRGGHANPELEARCDALGAFLDLPRAAFQKAREEVGDNPKRLAFELDTTETLVLLRLGEVIGTPVAVVSHVVRVRGDAYPWGDEPEIRGLAKARRMPRGVRRVQLVDETHRVGLVVRVA